MELILKPPLPTAIDNFYTTLLSVSGVLFGIAFAAMLFVLQSGFSSFKYSRRMFLELYLHFGRQLLYSLAYITAVPFLVVYFSNAYPAVSWLYAVYFAYFLNASLAYAKVEGYILTISSKKFVPRHYGRIRAYFRYISNRGLLRNMSSLVPLILVLTYPYVLSIYETGSLYLTKTATFYSCIIPLLLALFWITKFIPQFFFYTGLEMSIDTQTTTEENPEEAQAQNITEKRALREYLLNHGVSELNPDTPRRFLDGDITLNFLDQNHKSEAWFNINIKISNATPEQIRYEVLCYAYELAKRLFESRVGINTFVLSFHIYIGSQSGRNMFFRMSRSELASSSVFEIGDPEKIAELKNVLFDELFRH